MSSRQLIPIWTWHKKNELMTIGMSMETEICLIRGRISKDFHIERNSLRRDFCGPGETDKIQTIPRPDHIWPNAWTRTGKAAQRREKQEWAIEKLKLEHARKLRGSHSMDPSDEEHKDIIKNARRKLETPKGAAMPCKRAFSQASIRETVASDTKKQGIRSEDENQLYF